MLLTRSKGNMYPWVTHTWNPVGGECPHRCTYCYVVHGVAARSGKYKGTPYLIKKMLGDLYIHGKGHPSKKTIFVCSCIDLFAEDISDVILNSVLSHAADYPENRYLFQTKNPDKLWQCLPKILTKNPIIGTTIETNRKIPHISKAPSPIERIKAMYLIKKYMGYETMISIEPIIDFDLGCMVKWIEIIKPQFVSIGADSKGTNLREPSPEKIIDLINELKYITKIKIKPNLKRILEPIIEDEDYNRFIGHLLGKTYGY